MMNFDRTVLEVFDGQSVKSRLIRATLLPVGNIS